MRGKVSFEKLWQDIIEAQFPKTNKEQQNINQILGDFKRFAEDKVDQMRKQKDEELEQYKKDIERAKRFESQKATGGANAASTGGQAPITQEKLIVKRKAPGVAQGTGGPVQKVVRLNR